MLKLHFQQQSSQHLFDILADKVLIAFVHCHVHTLSIVFIFE